MTSELLARILAERASGKTVTLRDWLAENPPPDSAFTQTIAGVAVARAPATAFSLRCVSCSTSST